MQFYPPLIQDPNQAGVLLLGTYRLWRSGDRGDHWTALSGDITGGGDATITALAVAPGASQVVYAGTSDGLVKVSQDGGRNWLSTSAIPNRFVTSVVVDPRSPQRAIVGVSGFGSGHVFRTANSGASWEDLSRNLPDVPVNVVLLDAVSPDTIYIGTDIGVFVLGPSGAWAPDAGWFAQCHRVGPFAKHLHRAAGSRYARAWSLRDRCRSGRHCAAPRRRG